MDPVALEIKQLRDTLTHQHKHRLERELVAAALSGLCASMGPNAKKEDVVEKAIEIGTAAAIAFGKKHR